MSEAKAFFRAWLDELGLAAPDEVMQRFEQFHRLLWGLNTRLNLFSRATPASELWTKHFLDSLVPLKCVGFAGKKVLDFGSGGGLPGIPVKLADPDCQMTLLDSVRKKTVALEEMIGALGLADCEVVCSRLEDLHSVGGAYDLILLRAVRLEERYLKPLQRLLKPSGQAIFYKAQDLTDIAEYGPAELLRQDFEYGHRAIYALSQAQLKRQ